MTNSLFDHNESNSQMRYRQLFQKIKPFARPYKWSLAGVVLLVLALAIVSRLLPTLIGYAIDNGIIKKNLNLIFHVVIIYFALEITRAILMFAQSYFFQKLGNRILFAVREQLIRHTQNLPLTFFDKTPTGRIVTRVTNDVGSLGELFSEGLISILIHTVSLITIFIAMSLISIKLTLITISGIPIFLWVSHLLSEKIRITLRNAKRQLSRLNAFVAENISGMKVVQLYNRTARNIKDFVRLSKKYRDIQYDSIKYYSMLWPVISLFNAYAFAMAFYWGGLIKAENSLQIGSVIAFLMHVQDFIMPLRNIVERYQMFQNSLTSGERIFALLAQSPELDNGLSCNSSNVKGTLEFRDFSFKYADDLPWAVKNINLVIKPGSSVAIVGRTGSGKTTLISLLQRLYDYQHGEIFLDNIPIRTIKAKNLRRAVGVVQQDNFVFRGTLRENIGLHNDSVTDEDIINSIKLLGQNRFGDDFIKSLDFKIEEKGSNLSVGERQLIAFARIVAFNPPILVLDEATANIDSETELLIKEATAKVTQNRTSLIIAHRLSTIQKCNKIVVLHNGQIVEAGTHDELLLKKQHYYNLYQTQLQITPAEQYC